MKKNVEIKNRTSLQRVTLLGLIVTIGIVFGDIGTSPLYVMRSEEHTSELQSQR